MLTRSLVPVGWFAASARDLLDLIVCTGDVGMEKDTYDMRLDCWIETIIHSSDILAFTVVSDLHLLTMTL